MHVQCSIRGYLAVRWLTTLAVHFAGKFSFVNKYGEIAEKGNRINI